MLESYFKHETERREQGIPPLPLSPEITVEVCELLEKPPAGKEELLLHLLENRVAPGVDPAAKVKAEWLEKIAKDEVSSPALSRDKAVFLLGTMLGGFNVEALIKLLEDKDIAGEAAKALKQIILVYSAFDEIALSGAVEVTTSQIDTELLMINMSGACAVQTEGRADRQNIATSGSCIYDGETLDSREVTINVSGSSYIVVRVSELLEGQASGSAVVEYIGNPTVYVSISGTAVVQPH